MASASMSRPANASCSAGRPAPARARSSRWSTAIMASTRARSSLARDGEMVDLATASPRDGAASCAATSSAMSASSCAPCRASRRSTWSPSRWSRAASARDEARGKARALLARLNLPERLWSLPPATFSGGEQQRVNIARGFITDHPVLLLDEPTASLDATNRAVVVELIAEKKAAGVAMLGIFHDDDVRAEVADRIVDVTQFAAQDRRMTRLSETPWIDPTATVKNSTLGRYTEVGAGCHVSELDAGRLFLLRREHADRLRDDRQVRQHRGACAHLCQPASDASSPRCTISPTARRGISTTSADNQEFFDWRAEHAHHHRPRHLDRPWRGDHAGRHASAMARSSARTRW